jgi:hypothetical protein
MKKKSVVIHRIIATFLITLSITYFASTLFGEPQYQTVTCYSTTEVGDEGNHYMVYVCGTCKQKSVKSYSDQGTCKIVKQSAIE